jgi:curli production assembly/transport component CsgF
MRLLITLLLITTPAIGQEAYNFSNPSFSGQGFSQHILTLEQMTQKNEQAIDERERALAEQIQRELDNSNLNKFLNNVEARIYAEMSKQLVDAIFGDNPSESGVIELGGNTIEYRNDGVDVYLTITDQDGNTTEIVVPYGTLGIG